MKPMLLALPFLVAMPTVNAADPGNIVRHDAVAWGPAPPGLPPGAQIAVLSGDPNKPGMFVIRFKAPPGYVVAPHTHPTAENLTVISGVLYHSMSKTLDKTKGDRLVPGDFVYLPPRMPHAVWTSGDSPAELEIAGTGPFSIHYLNPADDPRTAH
jgi:quercetin dioxygenase-like cupin family protein